MATPAETRDKIKKAKVLARKKKKDAAALARGESSKTETSGSFRDKFREFFRNDSTDKEDAQRAVAERKKQLLADKLDKKQTPAIKKPVVREKRGLEDLNFSGPEVVLGERKEPPVKPPVKPVVKPAKTPVKAPAPKTFKDFSGAGALKRAQAAGVSSYLGADGKEKAALRKEDRKEGESLRDFFNRKQGKTRKMMAGGMAKKPVKKMMSGGIAKGKTSKVRGAGIARKGVRPAKMR